MRAGRTEITAKGRGKTWARSCAAAQRSVQDNERYFIRRSGGWLRPGAHGYTTELDGAGVFVGTDARGYLSAEGVVLIPISTMMSEVAEEIASLANKAVKLTALIKIVG